MYQRVRLIRNTCVAVAVLIAAAGTVRAAGPDPVKCRRAIALNAAKFERDKAKRLKKCQDFAQNGKAQADIDACYTDATAKFDATAANLQSAIATACTGVSVSDIKWDNRVKVCGTGAQAGLICQQNSDCKGSCFGGNPPGGAGAECATNSQCGGGLCQGGSDCALPAAGPSFCPNLESGKLPNYTAPTGGPTISAVACGTCNHGSNDGLGCRSAADCGTACEGGPDDGNACTFASDCHSFCAAGANLNQTCTSNSQCGLNCFSGPRATLACTVSADCNVCTGGTNDGTLCTSNAQCTGGGTCSTGNTCGTTLCAPSSCRGGTCNPGIKVNTTADAANCTICFGEASVDQTIGLAYDGLNPFSATNPAGKPVAAKLKVCKRAVGAETQKFFDKKRNFLRLCEDKVINGKLSGPCPDTTTAGKIAAAQASMIAKISDVTTGKCKGFTISQIGAPVSCPNVTIPGGASCAHPIDTVADLANCLACVTEFKVDCADAVAATFTTGTNEISSACNPLCGNGKIDTAAGETCDDGNVVDGDGCPADCNISACVNSGSTVTATVSFLPPPGVTDLSAMTLYVEYPDSKVRIPGQGSDQSVQDTINVPSGATYTPNDLNYALNILVNQPDLSAITSPAFTVDFQTCTGAPAPVSGDFRCLLRDAADTTGQAVFGGTCSVSVP